jgi:tRNA threonylcarbamoyladenosine biosynthesis protein TsaB
MNYILNIHTTENKAIVNICDEGTVLSTLINESQNQHARFLHSAIQELLQKNSISASDLKAIGVTGGPGSYTGIRIGLASAKGLCYALGIPMMMYSALELMAFTAIRQHPDNEKALFCPMIDARRMEVFCAVYDSNLNEIRASSALILNENCFSDITENESVLYFGSGASKFVNMAKISYPNLYYIVSDVTTDALAAFGWNKFKKNDFENLINAKPLYVKEFYTATKTA